MHVQLCIFQSLGLVIVKDVVAALRDMILEDSLAGCVVFIFNRFNGTRKVRFYYLQVTGSAVFLPLTTSLEKTLMIGVSFLFPLSCVFWFLITKLQNKPSSQRDFAV